MSVLFITHDMGVVAEIADRTVVMYDGQAVETGTTARIFARPRASLYARAARRRAAAGLDDGPGRARCVFRSSTLTGDLGRADGDAGHRGHRRAAGARGRQPRRRALRSAPACSAGSRAGFMPWRTSPSACMPGRRWRLSANPAAASRRPAARFSSLIEPTAAPFWSMARMCSALDRAGCASCASTCRSSSRIRSRASIRACRSATRSRHRCHANRLASSSQAREKVADLLAVSDLTADMASRFPHEFSGGQRQRICIARALALGPKLIIADEAVSALDVSVKAQVVNLMLDLQASMGLAYLFISHDIAVVERMSHRVAVMYLGEIVEIGPRAAVFGNPQHPYTKRLMAAVPIPDPARRDENAAYRTTKSGARARPRLSAAGPSVPRGLRRATSSSFGARNGTVRRWSARRLEQAARARGRRKTGSRFSAPVRARPVSVRSLQGGEFRPLEQVSGSASSHLEFGVQPVAETVAEHAEGEHRESDRKAGKMIIHGASR